MKLRVTKWKQKKDTKYSEDGLIRINSEKPKYGSMMLTASVIIVDNGYVNPKIRVGFITSTVEDLQFLIDEHKLVEGSNFSKMVSPHRIVVIEKTASELTDDDKGFNEKINPSTGEVLSSKGEVIYRKSEVVAEGSDIIDRLISHDREPVADEANKEFAKTTVIKEL